MRRTAVNKSYYDAFLLSLSYSKVGAKQLIAKNNLCKPPKTLNYLFFGLLLI
jgi:hypothetical protein